MHTYPSVRGRLLADFLGDCGIIRGPTGEIGLPEGRVAVHENRVGFNGLRVFLPVFSRIVGAWRSPVARLLWEQEVPSSNLGAPTNKFREIFGSPFFLSSASLQRVCNGQQQVGLEPATLRLTVAAARSRIVSYRFTISHTINGLDPTLFLGSVVPNDPISHREGAQKEAQREGCARRRVCK